MSGICRFWRATDFGQKRIDPGQGRENCIILKMYRWNQHLGWGKKAGWADWGGRYVLSTELHAFLLCNYFMSRVLTAALYCCVYTLLIPTLISFSFVVWHFLYPSYSTKTIFSSWAPMLTRSTAESVRISDHATTYRSKFHSRADYDLGGMKVVRRGRCIQIKNLIWNDFNAILSL